MSDDINKIDPESASDDFSLESIMAEYKGSAYINGEKKTPSEVLDIQADKIIREVLGDDMVNSLMPKSPQAGFGATLPEISADTLTNIAKAPLNADISKKNQLSDTINYNDPNVLLPDLDAILGETEKGTLPAAAKSPMQQDTRTRQDISQAQKSPIRSEIPIHQETIVRSEPLTRQEPSVISEFPGISGEPPIRPEIPPMQAPPPGPAAPPRRPTPSRRPSPESIAQAMPQIPVGSDPATRFFDNYNTLPQDTLGSIGFEVEKAINTGQGFLSRQTKPTRTKAQKREDFFDYTDDTELGIDGIDSVDEFYEPPLKDAALKFAKLANSISLRSFPSAIISIIMIITTFAFEAGMIIPFGIGRSLPLASGMLVLCQLIVMIICSDIIVRGYENLIKGSPNAETLILFSCVFSFVSGIFTLLGGTPGFLPYSAISVCSLTFASIGEKYNLRAITDTLKTALSSAEPYGIQGEFNSEVDKTILKKAYNRTDGFYTNLMRSDISETGYRLAAPILLIIALVLPLIVIIFRDGSEYFLHIFAAFFAAAAPFSALLAYALPFNMVAKSARKFGAALAGWGGSDDICFTDGACLTDEDLFPPGTLQINNPRLFSGETLEKAVRYTASIIIASGSGLSRIFSDILRSDNKSEFRVEDFACTEGGIRGIVRGELVETGSAAYMNLIGVRVPDGANMKNAVYTAINKKLVVVFPIEYTPVNSVQQALISILKWRIKLYLAARDFNVTPLMLAQKYKVSFEDIELIQTKDSYSFSDANSGKEGRMTAVLVRDGLGPYAEVLTGGRLLRTSAMFATILSIVSGLFGILLILFMSWSGALSSASPGSLLIFMFSMLASVLIVCGYVKVRR